MLKINIDSESKSVIMEVLLKGEKEPIEIKVTKYELRKDGDDYHLNAEEISTSREWMSTLASQYLDGKSILIPKSAAWAIKLFL